MIYSSCQHDDFDKKEDPSGNKVKEVSFVITLPEFSLPQKVTTRSMASKESEIDRIDVLLFKIDNSGKETLVEKNTGKNINQSGNTVKFKASLQQGLNFNIVLIANATSEIISIINNSSEGDSKAAILTNLTVANTGKWASDGSAVYTPIPMYGETGSKDITASVGSIDGIVLRRMLAKIDVTVLANNFTLKNVYLCNYNTQGYTSPYWDPVNGTVSMTTATTPNLPNSTNPRLGANDALKYEIANSSNTLLSEIYTFETIEANDGNETIRKNSVCLVAEGVYNNQTYFYRIDFTYDSGADKSNYMPLLRNHKYDVKIVQAEGIGYNTLEEALNSYTVMSNLKIRIMSYDESDMKDFNYNGQYMLALSDDGIIVSRASANYELHFKTDYPEGAEIISITDQEGTGTPCTWINTIDLTPAQKLEKFIVVQVSSIPNGIDARVGYINVKAGRISASFEIIQAGHTLKKTSNCYLAAPGSEAFLVPVSRAEEGIPGSLSRRNNFEEEFIWTDNSNGLASNGAVSQIKVYGKGRQALLLVKPGNQSGNAVVAVKNTDDGKIKWSWHMWICDYTPSSTDQFMDRNLGALGNFFDGNWWLSRGLYYQWGRKDPFSNMYQKITKPKPSNPSENIILSRAYAYNKDGVKIDGIPFDSFNDLLTSVENPLTFANGLTKEWAGSGSPKWSSWGEDGDKSVFDPSPEGWRVVKDLDSFDKSVFTSNISGWNNTSTSTVYGSTSYAGGYLTNSSYYGYFYPGGGGLFYGVNSEEVVNNDVAQVGYYWTAKSNRYDADSNIAKGYVFKITSSTVKDAPITSLRNRGFSVRCVRDN